MSAIFLERLLYSRAGIVGPIRTCLPSSSKVAFARYSTDRPDFSDDPSNIVDESPNPGGPSTTPTHSSTLRSRLFDQDKAPIRPYSDSPRSKPGVHRRDQRTRGQTPHERQRLDEALNQIFRSLDSGDFKSTGLFNDDSPAFKGAHSGQDPTGLKEWSPTIRRRTDREEDDRYTEELDEMKEEVSAISTDLELLDWARRRVFTATPTPTGDTALPLPTDTPEPLAFPKTYPRILAHVMKVSRQAFNNPHLALSFFHHARTSSTESYLVGCLASAYNELIRTRWECFRDLDGVDQAIREMDANAVSWDIKSQLVIGKIVEEVGREVLEKGTEAWGGERVYEVGVPGPKSQEEQG